MCVNDIAAQGAEPLFFLDYIACGKNDPALLEQVVSGVADGCVQAGSGLIGGETAEMPGMYDEDEYDLAGFAVGVAEKSAIVDGSTIARGRRAYRPAVHRRAFQWLLPGAQGPVRAGRLHRGHRSWTNSAVRSSATCCSPPPRSMSRRCPRCSRPAWSRASRTSPAVASSRTSRV